MYYHAILEDDGREIEVRFSADGAIWTWEPGRGQRVLCASDKAFEWVMRHVVRADRANALRHCITWPRYRGRSGVTPQPAGRPAGLRKVKKEVAMEFDS